MCIRDRLKVEPSKIEAIEKIAEPKNVKELQSFLGLASYYRRFVPNFSKIAEPSYCLTKKGVVFSFDEMPQKALKSLKEHLMSAPVLAYPKFSEPFIITTDASKSGIGAVLSQILDKEEKPINFASRSLNAAEKNYSTIERECLAIVLALHYFRPYIYGYKIYKKT